MIQYPNISPDIISVGNFAIRWYSMMYLLGYVIGHRIIKNRVLRGLFQIPVEAVDSLISHFVIGMLIGARLFYVVFYNAEYYMDNIPEALMVWKGGLSFHGAMVGMIVACALFAKKQKVSVWQVTDAMALAAGPGLFLGRIGNFINAELYGRASDLPWAMVFPTDPQGIPRHPSQLYQGLTEGLLLWLFLRWYQNYLIQKKQYRIGVMGGCFLIGYGVIRFLIEFTREPDAQVGYLFSFITMGQILCLAMTAAGFGVMKYVQRNPILKLSK